MEYVHVGDAPRAGHEHTPNEIGSSQVAWYSAVHTGVIKTDKTEKLCIAVQHDVFLCNVVCIVLY